MHHLHLLPAICAATVLIAPFPSLAVARLFERRAIAQARLALIVSVTPSTSAPLFTVTRSRGHSLPITYDPS